MHVPRIYTPQELKSGREIVLDTHASMHLLRVLRLKTGESLRVFDGCGHEFHAALSGSQKNLAVVTLADPWLSNPESPLNIHLGQGISRGEKMDYTIQKAVELGVSKITPLFTQYSGVSLTEARIEKRLAHWQAVIINACEQSGRNILPTIEIPMTLAKWLSQRTESLKLMLQPDGDRQLHEFSAIAANVALVVGPEGGFSVEESLSAKQAGFHTLSLGPRILRTETAAPAAIALMQYLWGDFAPHEKNGES
ncbi:MAG TPA: 16S rRNA (uracil(1498)-N(3))-methyltransferase [Gammaproteobacteria bacterium]|nr:16S rRNA (uracil(1498)-N(3))-methyltransferase [Gammaproteobacteria bacterium]